ncbi:MAG: hypothetical protein IJW45_06360 [Oscillospiraceae bacterium]|nr:hypothetical protein [Oscillospiraceae bacterium]
MNNKYVKMALVALLCVAMILPFVSFESVDVSATGNYSGAVIDTTDAPNGVKLSILGDSISTYQGVSNDVNANSTIGKNAVFYSEARDDVASYNYFVTRKDTWWQQAADTLDMDVLVNNSWSGSRVFGDGTDTTDPEGTAPLAAWKGRCMQLHDDAGTNAGTKPDIIAVYMGTNDIKAHSGIDTFGDNQAAMIAEGEDTSDTDFQYPFSKYVRMVYNILTTYSNAEVYLFTLLPHEGQTQVHRTAMTQFNQSVRDLVTYYQGKGKAVYLVDLYNDSGITSDFSVIDRYLGNSLHPNDAGMDCITNCFVSSILRNSKYFNSSDFCSIEYDLDDVFVDGGNVGAVRLSDASSDTK